MSGNTTKQVRDIVKSQYEYWNTFNDLRKDKKSRRLKFMRNGYFFDQKDYDRWDANIRRAMENEGIQFSDAGFRMGQSYRGNYMYYQVVLPA